MSANNAKRRSDNIQITEEQYTRPGTTFTVQNAADTADSFTEAERRDNREKPVKAEVHVKTNAGLRAYGADPSSGSPEIGVPFAEGDTFWLEGNQAIKDFQWINSTGGQQVTLSVTMFYRET